MRPSANFTTPNAKMERPPAVNQFGPIAANNVGLAVAGNDPFAPAFWNLYVSFANRCQAQISKFPMPSSTRNRILDSIAPTM